MSVILLPYSRVPLASRDNIILPSQSVFYSGNHVSTSQQREGARDRNTRQATPSSSSENINKRDQAAGGKLMMLLLTPAPRFIADRAPVPHSPLASPAFLAAGNVLHTALLLSRLLSPALGGLALPLAAGPGYAL